MIPPISPESFFEKFVREHPVQAVLFVLVGVLFLWVVLWFLVMR